MKLFLEKEKSSIFVDVLVGSKHSFCAVFLWFNFFMMEAPII